MTNDPKTFLSHITVSIEALENYTAKVTENQFYIDRKLQMASIKELEIIGEAVRNLPTEFKEKYPQVPWKDIAGMRSFLTKIPELKEEIQVITREII